MLTAIPQLLVATFPETSKYLTLEYSISKEAIYCLVSEVKGKAVVLEKYHPIKYEQ